MQKDKGVRWQRIGMGYDEVKMKSMKDKMTVYDEFLKEYEYWKKHCGVKDKVQKKQRDRK
ncbi:MAG: hypothetical protein K2I10_05175 [Lachnospiraceae bacterium]|nr:hypothetical protein [Lachnospiraceae bacterium]